MSTDEHVGETSSGHELTREAGPSPSAAIRRRREERPATQEEMEAFDAAVAKWYGRGKERMGKLGFETTDDFMKAIRGR